MRVTSSPGIHITMEMSELRLDPRFSAKVNAPFFIKIIYLFIHFIGLSPLPLLPVFCHTSPPPILPSLSLLRRGSPALGITPPRAVFLGFPSVNKFPRTLPSNKLLPSCVEPQIDPPLEKSLSPPQDIDWQALRGRPPRPRLEAPPLFLPVAAQVCFGVRRAQ